MIEFASHDDSAYFKSVGVRNVSRRILIGIWITP